MEKVHASGKEGRPVEGSGPGPRQRASAAQPLGWAVLRLRSIRQAYALAKDSIHEPNKLQRVARYFAHSKSSDKNSIQYHHEVSNTFHQLWLEPAM
jgi:hypothetical protein